MSTNGEDNDGPVVCCFNRSSEISKEIDPEIRRLREEVAQAKKLISELCAEITSAFEAQLAAVEMRRKILHLSMNICPDVERVAQSKQTDWDDFLTELPARTRNAVKQDKIESFEELCRLSESEALRIPNFGRLSLAHLKGELARRGLSLLGR